MSSPGRIEGGEFAEDLIGLRLMVSVGLRLGDGSDLGQEVAPWNWVGRRARRSFRVISGVMMQGPFSLGMCHRRR